MNIALRIFAAFTLLAVLLFCAFGFRATFEYAEPLRRLPWQAGYGVAGLACMVALIRLFRRRSDASTRGQ